MVEQKFGVFKRKCLSKRARKLSAYGYSHVNYAQILWIHMNWYASCWKSHILIQNYILCAFFLHMWVRLLLGGSMFLLFFCIFYPNETTDANGLPKLIRIAQKKNRQQKRIFAFRAIDWITKCLCLSRWWWRWFRYIGIGVAEGVNDKMCSYDKRCFKKTYIHMYTHTHTHCETETS